MNGNIHDLLHLIAENPDLPILPLVASEGIIADDSYTSWCARWGAARIEEILSTEERLYIKSEDDRDDTLEQIMGYDAFSALPEDEDMDALWNALPWKKTIVVSILPLEG